MRSLQILEQNKKNRGSVSVGDVFDVHCYSLDSVRIFDNVKSHVWEDKARFLKLYWLKMLYTAFKDNVLQL